ncbi:16S rRNA (guanine(966)-N(2))-methyltransferase RsmD [Luteimonas yindakuii]|uniref:16S rRNA (guanine(966)-N(2))-methyltransferase RsmD n=1 Tax=Luteimonas yindakuii TaxID=2565782 RepID=UPI0010A3CAAD|nr:16S rRNA (guanine(966)-N(2))-methyltransferase RsmD [Luteimonas yindakuii]
MSRRNSPAGAGAPHTVRGPSMGSVRIVGGRWRGTRLPVPDAPGLRPTSDRARETLFNWLQPWLPGARVLDLFAGSGALGLEAVSRGAAQAVLVERDAALADALDASVHRLDARDSVQVVRADVREWLRAPLFGRFDGVFCDPPFEAGLWATVLERLDPWLNDAAWLYLESPASAPVEPAGAWRLHREGGTRDARHALYRRGG